MKIAVFAFAACLAATPALSQDYDPWSDTWEWGAPAPDPDEELRMRDPGAWALKHFGDGDESFRLEYEARQEYNRVVPCMHTNNEAWQARCFQSLGR